MTLFRALCLLILAAPLAAQTFQAPEHNFWDRQNKISFAATAGIRAADIAQTCYNLHHGGHEDGLPTQRCSVATAIISSEQAGQLFLQWAAHRRGWHRLERILPYIAVGPNGYGLAYSFSHLGSVKPAQTQPLITDTSGSHVVGFCIVGQTC